MVPALFTTHFTVIDEIWKATWKQVKWVVIYLILTWESSRGRHPNGFMCLTCAHTILVGLVLSWKEVERQDPHPFRQQLLVSSGAFRTQQRVTLARVPQLLPQHLPVSRGSLWKRTSEEVGEETPRSLYRPPKMSWSRQGLEEDSRHETEWEGNKVY